MVSNNYWLSCVAWIQPLAELILKVDTYPCHLPLISLDKQYSPCLIVIAAEVVCTEWVWKNWGWRHLPLRWRLHWPLQLALGKQGWRGMCPFSHSEFVKKVGNYLAAKLVRRLEEENWQEFVSFTVKAQLKGWRFHSWLLSKALLYKEGLHHSCVYIFHQTPFPPPPSLCLPFPHQRLLLSFIIYVTPTSHKLYVIFMSPTPSSDAPGTNQTKIDYLYL